MRPRHTKSRLGCKECKTRRVKCDELRPCCTRCSQARRRCSFLGENPTLPSPARSISRSVRSVPEPSPLVLGPLPITTPPALEIPRPVPSVGSLEECYSSLHLRLLYHFEHELADRMRAQHPGMDFLIELFVCEAFKTPYLMDELLAYSAAHKSSVDEENRQFYYTEATRLQTRALELYNSSKPDVSEETCRPMFIFCSLLSHQLLFDLHVSSRNDLGAALDGLTHSIIIHRGLSAIAKSSWPIFDERLQNQFLENCHLQENPLNGTTQNECARLLERLDDSELSRSQIAVHREAVKLLQTLFDEVNSGGHVIRTVQDWLVLVSSDFVQCLERRRPEALVVLAYYAVLLHRASPNWFVANLGKHLIRLIDAHLGPFWADWLKWPIQMTESREIAAGSSG